MVSPGGVAVCLSHGNEWTVRAPGIKKGMRDGDEKVRISYQYLLERHTEKRKPDGTRMENTGDPHFEILI
jgi:hypothetical protein